MSKNKTPHHDRLQELREAVAAEGKAGRALEDKAEAARAGVADARTQMVQAEVDGKDVRGAEKQRARCETDLERAQIKCEAAAIRIERATRERQNYEQRFASELMAELEPKARAVVERLERAVAEVVAADREWSSVLDEVNGVLTATPGASPRADARIGHRLAEPVRELRKAAAAGPVESPMPTWTGRQAHEANEAAVRQLREGQAA